ncbi:hypothetical protein EDI_253110 [Entamoeba dispar SAW760]|uniref:Leucine-rich repeat containing protein n=1 Tax=Entamoeba dispar (strain ATCC PRA-260 / SAW760) TaxID=370354 RepID=B0EFB6_ENTDS|nr:uncharacterized protein EDI_253110 [Entamoeba dispar SAW760]EDR26846.1 hypothetical protein EDI_253110 [Entamoeba dispar SAW760]|eukprot:EDR26846.1 hypothetical protein EDI_253110 [Entamoeba dispar SAW760]
MVYLMNVSLYFTTFQTFQRFVQVNKKCKRAICSLRYSQWYNEGSNKIFHSCETLEIKTFKDSNDVIKHIPSNIQRIIFSESPDLDIVNIQILKFVVNGNGFIQNIKELFQLECFTFKIVYNFVNLDEIEDKILKYPWNDLLSLPNLKRIIIKCSYCSTPFFVNIEKIHQFNSMVLRITKLLSLNKQILIELQMENLDDYCVNEFKKNNQIILSYTGPLSSKITHSILTKQVILKTSYKELTFGLEHISDSSIIKICQMYLPKTIHVRPFTISTNYQQPLFPNQSQSSSEDNNTQGIYSLNELTSIQNIDILISQSISFELPISILHLITNVPISNLDKLNLISLDIKTEEQEFHFPSTLTSLKITHSPLISINNLSLLKTLNCFDCSSLEYINNLPNLVSLSLMNCNNLTKLEINSPLYCLTLLQLGLTSITIPSTIIKMVIDTQIKILNSNNINIKNSYEIFNYYH